MATPEFLHICLKNRFLPKVYTLKNSSFRETMMEDVFGEYFHLISIISASLSLTNSFKTTDTRPFRPLCRDYINFPSITCSKSCILQSVRQSEQLTRSPESLFGTFFTLFCFSSQSHCWAVFLRLL